MIIFKDQHVCYGLATTEINRETHRINYIPLIDHWGFQNTLIHLFKVTNSNNQLVITYLTEVETVPQLVNPILDILTPQRTQDIRLVVLSYFSNNNVDKNPFPLVTQFKFTNNFLNWWYSGPYFLYDTKYEGDEYRKLNEPLVEFNQISFRLSFEFGKQLINFMGFEDKNEISNPI